MRNAAHNNSKRLLDGTRQRTPGRCRNFRLLKGLRHSTSRQIVTQASSIRHKGNSSLMAHKFLNNQKNENHRRRRTITGNISRLGSASGDCTRTDNVLYHINDLPDAVTSSVRLFADDCLLYRTMKNENDQKALQADLQNLEIWANKWGMRFNAKKCYILSINQIRTKFYQLNNHILQEVQNNPYLGLEISNDLKWNIHINNVCKKANTTLGFLRRNLSNVPENCRKTAYISLVRSTMEYGATIWNPYSKGDIDKLERIQNRATRFIEKDYHIRSPGNHHKDETRP